MTLPNFPAEIRAPPGTLPGVSCFQVHFADHDILTPGDAPDVLVAMNPAALKANLGDLPPGATIIVNTDDFTSAQPGEGRLRRQPARRLDEVDTLAAFIVHPVDLTGMTVEAVKEFGLSRKDAARAKNMFALGLLSWMYGRPTESTPSVPGKRVREGARHPRRQHRGASRPGWNFGETTETFAVALRGQARADGAGHLPQHHRQPRPGLGPGRGRGAVRAAGVPRRLPDHPGLRHPPRAVASTRHFGVTHLPGRGRDRRRSAPRSARPSAARSASPRPPGPGVALKSETIGLAVMPSCRCSSSTCSAAAPPPGCRPRPSRPTCCRPCTAATVRPRCRSSRRSRPADCFDAALEAARIAVTYRTPVILLSDGYLANGSEPWRVPDVGRPARPSSPASPPSPTTTRRRRRHGLLALPARPRDPGPPLGRPRHPGPGAPHRRPGEGRRPRQHLLRPGQPRPDGAHPRRPRSTRIAACPAARGRRPRAGAARGARLGWGSTYGPIGAGRRRVRDGRLPVAQAHLRHLNPFPANLGDVLARYDKVLVPEMNLGQLSLLLRGPLPRRRDRLQPGPRPALQGRRAGRGHRRAGRRGRGRRPST